MWYFICFYIRTYAVGVLSLRQVRFSALRAEKRTQMIAKYHYSEKIMNQCIEVPASQAGVLRLIAFADEIEQRDQLSFDQNYLLRLVIEEIATNIVKYGYPPDAPGVIQLQCMYEAGSLRVIIRDHGQPFD